jgi:DNA-binding transcriptional MerR regulator
VSDPPEASQPGEPTPTRPAKGASAFRTIGEVADDLDLPAHVLRFWESKFPKLKPLKRAGGRRYYRPEDIVLLRRIRQCLYQDGYTIRGVQKLLGVGAVGVSAGGRDAPTDRATAPSLFPLDAEAERAARPDRRPTPAKSARRARQRPANPDTADPATRAALEELRRELIEVRGLLDELLLPPKGG